MADVTEGPREGPGLRKDAYCLQGGLALSYLACFHTLPLCSQVSSWEGVVTEVREATRAE